MKRIKAYRFEEVKLEEDKFLQERRKNIFDSEDADQLEDNRFGIAFSGGGIRSASICLGAVKVLSQLGILKRADYISSVSGGGYTNAYVQAALRNGQDYDRLVDDAFIDYMREQGSDYMSDHRIKIVPVKTLTFFNVLANILIGLINPLILISLFVLIAYTIYALLLAALPPSFLEYFSAASRFCGGLALLSTVVGMMGYYFFKASFKFYQICQKTTILFVGLMLFSLSFVYAEAWTSKLGSILPSNLWYVLLIDLGLIGLGFFTNVNSISFGRIYGDSLTQAFLNSDTSILLKDLCTNSDNTKQTIAPYPLFNCCLNIELEGASSELTADYFLLSPQFCGSKYVRYVQTQEAPVYNELSLSRAMTTSAAAINTGMGTFSSGMTSILIGLFNFRTGALLPNPKKTLSISNKFTWWPRYYLRSLLLNNSERNNVLDISDGGHIENLAVFELLKRRCRLIIGFDGGMDAEYAFEDLKNLIRRARNELGIEIRWRENNNPFEEIGRGINGFSRKRFAIADLYLLSDKTDDENGRRKTAPNKHKKIGTYVYVKSSLTAPKGVSTIDKSSKGLERSVYQYKKYNYDFPHHSTSDQSFEPTQFEAYYQLGQYLCSDILGIRDWSNFQQGPQAEISRELLLDILEGREQLEKGNSRT